MSTYPSIPTTVEIKRGRLFSLFAAVAVLAAAVTWILVAFAFDGASSSTAAPAAPAVQGHMSYLGRHTGVDSTRTPSIMSVTPAGLAANALGTGYALPSAQEGPSIESVLASMTPQTREYTKRIMNLTFAQLAAGAAGQP
jgi:hypothetical protein